MADCNHDCSSCGEACAERDPKSFLEEQNELTNIKKIIGVVSGKGGVGKSLVTSMLASAMQKTGRKVGIMDADITGPSIPRAFGIKEPATSDGQFLYPVKTESGIEIISMNLLLPNSTDPVVWRGPVIAGAVKQFYTDVAWNEVDYLFVDMPPGTGDVPLTVFQSLPVDGIIIVTSPQELVSMIVEKAVRMAAMMSIPVLGIVENMSYYECPDCGKRHAIFGESHIEELADPFGINAIAKLPIDPAFAKAVDRGLVETLDTEGLQPVIDEILLAAPVPDTTA